MVLQLKQPPLIGGGVLRLLQIFFRVPHDYGATLPLSTNAAYVKGMLAAK